MRENRATPMVEAGIMAAVAVMFAVISTYIPVIGLFADMVWPVPIILLAVRHGIRWSLMAVAVAGVIILIVLNPLQALVTVVGSAPVGLVLGYWLRRQSPAGWTLFWGSAASLVSKVAVLGIALLLTGKNPLTVIVATMDQSFAMSMEFYRGMGVSAEMLAQLEGQLQATAGFLRVVLPAGLAVGSIIGAYLNFLLARAVLSRLGQPVRGLPPFKEWSLPRATLYVFLVAIALAYYGRQSGAEILYHAGVNMKFIIDLLLLVQGLALIYYLADKYNLSRLVRGIILLLILTNPLFAQAAIFAGAIDIAFDYRKLHRSGAA